jgi:hypothetical protein
LGVPPVTPLQVVVVQLLAAVAEDAVQVIPVEIIFTGFAGLQIVAVQPFPEVAAAALQEETPTHGDVVVEQLVEVHWLAEDAVTGVHDATGLARLFSVQESTPVASLTTQVFICTPIGFCGHATAVPTV